MIHTHLYSEDLKNQTIREYCIAHWDLSIEQCLISTAIKQLRKFLRKINYKYTQAAKKGTGFRVYQVYL
jgi:hypothetical protein